MHRQISLHLKWGGMRRWRSLGWPFSSHHLFIKAYASSTRESNCQTSPWRFQIRCWDHYFVHGTHAFGSFCWSWSSLRFSKASPILSVRPNWNLCSLYERQNLSQVYIFHTFPHAQLASLYQSRLCVESFWKCWSSTVGLYPSPIAFTSSLRTAICYSPRQPPQCETSAPTFQSDQMPWSLSHVYRGTWFRQKDRPGRPLGGKFPLFVDMLNLIVFAIIFSDSFCFTRFRKSHSNSECIAFSWNHPSPFFGPSNWT